jgi:hypothetical protein
MTGSEADTDARRLADAFRHRLGHLRFEGQRILSALSAPTAGSTSPIESAKLAIWQRECASTVSQLSGGSKAHWLARRFSDALLVPDAESGSAGVATITRRIIAVLDSAETSLAGGTAATAHESDPAALKPRFTFIKDETLRPQLERAYVDARSAFTRGEIALALVTYCSILETVITDALERRGVEGLEALPPATSLGSIADWSFSDRIEAAERARLISRGCARLPEIARRYRDLLGPGGSIAVDAPVTSREAKLAGDVLHVVLRDLAPGR